MDRAVRAPRREQWGVADVAAHLGVRPGTVRAYVARGQMPPPDGRLGRTPWWWAASIQEWTRPGQGSRADLRA